MEKKQPESKATAFVYHVIESIKEDKGMRARLRRADNPATEYQSWEYLARFGVNLEDTSDRRAFATVGAAIARATPEKNGTIGMGKAIAMAYPDGQNNDQAKARLCRLLACASTEEACDILRPILQLVSARNIAVDFAKLLQELLYFSEKTKERWAQEFFRSPATSKEL